MPAERGKPDSRGLNFFDITDFSPGIYDASLISDPTIGNVPGVFPAPPGAARQPERRRSDFKSAGGSGFTVTLTESRLGLE